MLFQVYYLLSRAGTKVATAFRYAAAGLTPLSHLRNGLRERWNRFYIRPEEISSGWTESEAAIWVSILREKAGARLLVIGSGACRDVIPLLERGHSVTAVDPAEQATAVGLAAVAARGLTATFLTGFIEDVQLHGVFDVVWFSWFAYGYIPESSRRVTLLSRLRSHLVPDGRLALSYPSPPLTSRSVTIGRFMARIFRTDWQLEPGDIVDWVQAGPLLTYEHRFEPAEAEREIRDAGYDIVLHDASNQTIVACLPRTSSILEAPKSTNRQSC